MDSNTTSTLFDTPNLDHIDPSEYESMYSSVLVLICRYEPDQDSFLFLDSLEKEFEQIQAMKSTMILEIGPGSGIISTFLSRLIRMNGYSDFTKWLLTLCILWQSILIWMRVRSHDEPTLRIGCVFVCESQRRFR